MKNNELRSIPVGNIDKKACDDFLNELRKEPLLKGKNITIENANLYFESLKSFKNCKNCKGLNECKNSIPGFNKVFDEKSQTLKASMCKYKEAQEAYIHDTRLFKTMFMPDTILNCSLEDYRLDTPRRRTAYKLATKFIDNAKNHEPGLYLAGTFDMGKTYLLAAIANELSKRGVKCILAYFPDLVREIKNNMTNGAKLEEILNTLKTVDVLLLDDFGSENLSNWLRDEILGPILNYRYEAKLPLCISSNLTSNALSDHLANTNDGSDRVKGARIMKRIMYIASNYVEF